jgi:hypothetical protein
MLQLSMHIYYICKFITLIKKKFTLLDFIEELITGLATVETITDALENKGVLYQKRSTWESFLPRLLPGNHTPRMDMDTNTTQFAKWHRLSGRSQCVICESKCGTYCMNCQARLCIRSGVGVMNCWEKFHNCKKFPNIDTIDIDKPVVVGSNIVEV